MVDHGTHLSVQAIDMSKELPGVLRAVQAGRTVTITDHGKELAEIRPVSRPVDPLRVHSEYSATKIAPDAFEPVDNEDWPEDCR